MEITVAIPPNHCDWWPNRTQFIQNPFRANVAQMPNFISRPGKIENVLGQFVVRVRQNEYAQCLFHSKNFAQRPPRAQRWLCLNSYWDFVPLVRGIKLSRVIQ